MKIAFLVPYPLNEVPSQRFRFEQYFQALEQKHEISKYPFFSAQSFRSFYRNCSASMKAWIITKGIFSRCITLAKIMTTGVVFLHREAAPIGPPVFEWIIAKILRKRIIYDFDDAIWLTDKADESRFEKIIRWRSKVGLICRWSYKISCGNEYLADFARKFNSNVVTNPTTIETEKLHNPNLYQTEKSTNRITIGWTGSHSTLKYLNSIIPIIQLLQEKNKNINFMVIADQKPELQLERFEFVPWKKETEAQDLLKLDIGIMPLPDDEWTRGKCGFKALQYMAMRIPCVVSPVGVNSIIVDQGQTGFVAATGEEWMTYLEKLIRDGALRITMGEVGRKKVIEHYSVASNTANFLSLFA